MPPTYPLTGTAAAELEARLGNFRLAQSRLGFMNPLIRMTIAGTDRVGLIEKTSIRITKRVNVPATLTFSTIWDPGFAPTEGQEVILAVGAISNRRFGGHITNVKQVHNPQGGRVLYSVTCQDYSWLFDRRQVCKTYGIDTVESIIADLVSTYTTGFTTSHVQQGLGRFDDGMPFTMEKPTQCLKRLADKVGATFYIDPFKDVHFFTTDAAATPHDLTSSFKDYENVVLETDLSQIITRVYVEGAGSTLAQQWDVNTDLFLTDNTNFNAAGGDVRIGAYAPTGTARLRYSATASSNRILMSGGVDFDPIIFATINNSPYLPFPIGTPVNMWLKVDDAAAQTALAALEGGDGIHESYIQDRRLSLQGMTDRGNGELTANKTAVDTLTYRTHDPNTRPGAKVTVNLSAPASIAATFTIQTVTETAYETATNRHPWLEVEATSKSRTLWDLYRATLGLTAVEGH